MKKLLAVISIASLMMMFSCSKKQNASMSEQEVFQKELTAADSTEAMKISNDFMALLQNGKVDEALDALKSVDSNRNVTALSDEIKDKLRNQFKMLPVINYTVTGIMFEKPDSNFVSYQYVAQEATDDLPDLTVGFRTMPVKIDGEWYLTLPSDIEKSN